MRLPTSVPPATRRSLRVSPLIRTEFAQLLEMVRHDGIDGRSRVMKRTLTAPPRSIRPIVPKPSIPLGQTGPLGLSCCPRRR